MAVTRAGIRSNSGIATSSQYQRNKPLTQAEKARIRQFHQENPFVTHQHIAGKDHVTMILQANMTVTDWIADDQLDFRLFWARTKVLRRSVESGIANVLLQLG